MAPLPPEVESFQIEASALRTRSRAPPKKWVGLGVLCTVAAVAALTPPVDSPDWDAARTALFGGGYQDQTAVNKLRILWELVTSDKTSGPFQSLGLGAVYRFLHKSYLRQTAETANDAMPTDPWRHSKYIHAVGAVGKAHFEWNENSAEYSGLFQKADHCMLRFSSAKTPSPHIAPGMGVKCLRDGVPSGNFVAMWQLDGYDAIPTSLSEDEKTCNYFAVPFSNHVANRNDLPASIRWAAYATFQRVDEAPGWVGLSSFAKDPQDATVKRFDMPRFPFALVFVPTAAAKALPCTKESLSQFAHVKPGMALYEVYAARQPFLDYTNPDVSPDLVHIGALKADSAFVPSKYGDGQLFFQHDFFATDQAYYPEWKGLETNDTFKANEGALVYAKHIKELRGEVALDLTQLPEVPEPLLA